MDIMLPSVMSYFSSFLVFAMLCVSKMVTFSGLFLILSSQQKRSILLLSKRKHSTRRSGFLSRSTTTERNGSNRGEERPACRNLGVARRRGSQRDPMSLLEESFVGRFAL